MGRDQAKRAEIESTIESARQNITKTIDEIDSRIRGQLDIRKMASEHAPQMMAAGAAFGFMLGYGVPKVFLRTAQIGVPIVIAVQLVRAAKKARGSICDCHEPADRT